MNDSSEEFFSIITSLSPYSLYAFFKLYLCPSLACHESISELQTTNLIKNLRVSSRELKLSIDELTVHDLIKTSFQIDRVRVGRSSKVVQKIKSVEELLLSVIDEERIDLIVLILKNKEGFERPLMTREIAFLVFCLCHSKSIAMTDKYIKTKFRIDICSLMTKIQGHRRFNFKNSIFQCFNRTEVDVLFTCYCAIGYNHSKPDEPFELSMIGLQVPLEFKNIFEFMLNYITEERLYSCVEQVSDHSNRYKNFGCVGKSKYVDFNKFFINAFNSQDSVTKKQLLCDIEVLKGKGKVSTIKKVEERFLMYLFKRNEGGYKEVYLDNIVRSIIKELDAVKQMTTLSFLIKTFCTFYLSELINLREQLIRQLEGESIFQVRMSDDEPSFFDVRIKENSNILLVNEVFRFGS
ncbi:hypothetical protein AUR67_17360 [Pseudoalteromonas sp. XI10]|uniref:hypothetical protein n=1 Tax=Pseudoalteromonas sp. XI10 TaxID=1766621 RepID=UPI0007337F7A|nr:hypothetical protein [Pseudoalteromonas sp. XI10]KTG18922.1 hypothetical protein AUR67_17360 [Pseudoalteromonas sp. XI10]